MEYEITEQHKNGISILDILGLFMSSIAFIQFSLCSNFEENAIAILAAQNRSSWGALIRIHTKLITLE